MQLGSKSAQAAQTVPKWSCKSHQLTQKEIEKREKNQPPYVFTWWQEDTLQCPKCKRKVVAMHKPDQPIQCRVCWVKILKSVPIMVPVKKKDGSPIPASFVFNIEVTKQELDKIAGGAEAKSATSATTSIVWTDKKSKKGKKK